MWAAFIEGSAGSGERLFKERYTDLYRYAYRMTSDPELSKELIQELFLRLFEKREKLPTNIDSPRGYLLKMMRNLLIDRRRGNRLHTVDLEDTNTPLLVAADPTMEQRWITREASDEQTRKLAAGLNVLTPAQREIVILRYYQELPFETIETLTGLSYQTIRNYLSQGLKRLRKDFFGKSDLV